MLHTEKYTFLGVTYLLLVSEDETYGTVDTYLGEVWKIDEVKVHTSNIDDAFRELKISLRKHLSRGG